jgi:hypothetical protein
MVTNKQLLDILKKGEISLSDDEINEVRVLMIELAKIEYSNYGQKFISTDAADKSSIINLSNTIKKVA